MKKVKFTFYLKSGKVFDCITELNVTNFLDVVSSINTSFNEGCDGYVALDFCIVRLSECAVVEWECLDE